MSTLSQRLGTMAAEAALVAVAPGAAAMPPADAPAPPNPRLADVRAVAGAAAVRALIDEDFVYTAPDGDWLDRDGYLDRAAAHPPAPGAVTEDLQLRPYGALLLVHAVTRGADAARPDARVRHTDLYRWSGRAWRLLHAQDTALKPGVATGLQTTTPPAVPGWTGQDPTGSEHEVLVALNDAYVRAFRASDIAWYDVHLTADYRVVSGDGSMQDRAAALAHFARPTFATSMRTFPVDRVRVRRFGDLALIHAENAYTLKDGRTGVSRYTDIWVLRDGRWRCAAAHITVVRPPG